MKIKNIFLYLFIVGFSSCASESGGIKMPTLTSGGSKVIVVKTYDTSKCSFVGKIAGEAKGYSSGAQVWAAAMNDIRNKASFKNGNLVLMRNYTHSKDNSNALKIRIFGDVFICGAFSGKQRPRRYQHETRNNVGYSTVPPDSKTAPNPPASDESSPESGEEIHPPVHP